ncbi:uncharacterized protein si:ch211-199g17.2 isoform X2 [Silurus meridionalis]|uniref:uncharacterized protein si:ch211-199g17.2 isoform X2 n=1 Tax=Silurus meridionalis TaxID=175797 RepID=UPI001EE9DFB9|nr:uncharacterized protein si:ch211-199g17.2 isoform X2 [Silurus meridionalis]
MKPLQLICQNCNMHYETIKEFKIHIRNLGHKKEVAKLYQTAVHKGPVYVPMFVFLDYLRNPNQPSPLIGFDTVTMFITPEKIGAFYMCHVCEEQLSTANIVSHLSSDHHYFKYLAYTNPELLQFAWLNDSFSYLQSSAIKEYNSTGAGKLRVIELPNMMLRKYKKLQYPQVMAEFSKTDKLMECVKAGLPLRKSIQEYIAEPARTNPLLGLNLLLEYSCPKKEGFYGYLCILCKKQLSAPQCISHCISFDHVYSYLEAAHPAILDSSKSKYSHYSYSFHKKILCLANRAQTLCPPAEIHSITLDLESFKEIHFSSYTTALGKLQAIWRKRNQTELNFSITPGAQIKDHEPSAKTATTDGSTEQQEEKTQIEASVTQTKDEASYKILCVECDQTLNFIKDYKLHITREKHKQKLIELFGPVRFQGAMSKIKVYQDLWNRHTSKSFRPLIGLSLLTVFVQRNSAVSKPFYLCHACELNIPVSSVSIHLTSTQHYLNVFAYSKPDLVYLGSQNLDQCAKEEEQNQGKQKMVLQVCELSPRQFTGLHNLTYEKCMEIIGKHNPKLKKCIEVEKRMTLELYSDSCERKVPLLGLQFMVKYTTTQHCFKCGYLCLLCEKKLSERQAIVHVLRFPHMFTYLDMAHPGSLKREDSEQVSLIMDLGKQAEKIAPNTTLRKVDLSIWKFNEVDKSSFTSALSVLQALCKDEGLGELKPTVVPGARLVSSVKEINSSQCEEQERTPPDTNKINIEEACTDTPINKTNKQSNSEYPDLLHTNHKELSKTSFISSHHVRPDESSLATTHSDSSSTQPPISFLHEEQSELRKLDEKSVKQEGFPDQISTNDDPNVKMSHPQTQDSSVPQQQNVELAQKSVKEVEGLQKPTQSLACSEAETPAVPLTQLSTCTKLQCYLKMPNRQPVIGLKSVIECWTVGQKPFYVCVTCGEKYEESSIIEHLLSHRHRLQYLESINYGPSPGEKVTDKWLQAKANLVEKMQGCGEAETLKLDAKDYHEISSAHILNALGKLREFLLKLASEICTQSPKADCPDCFKSDESQEPETFKRIKETEEKDIPCAHFKETVTSTKPETKPDTEPETSIQRPDDPARGSPYLWSYLTSATRKEPVIGLSMITEYRNSNGQNSFLCSCCNVILATHCYMGHLINPRHRFNYIKLKNPEFLAHWKGENFGTFEVRKITELQKKAQILQDSEGWGCLKVVEKDHKQPQKQASDETFAKVQKLEPSKNSGDTEPQDLMRIEPKPKKRQNMIGPESSAKVQKMEPSQTIDDAEQDHTSYEPKPAKQQSKKKMNKCNAVIGLNFVTCVHHGKKKLYFCELCSVRGHLDHMSSVTHRKKYVKHKYPDWTASDTNMEKKLHKIALRLAAVERSTRIGMKKLNVTAEVFTALSTAPLNEALSQLKLLQTKPEDAAHLKTSFQPEANTFSDHEHGTHSNSMDHMICSAAITNSLQQEKSPLQKNNLAPNENPDSLNSADSCDTPSLKSSCTFSIPVPFLPNKSLFSTTVHSPLSSATELHSPSSHSSQISPSPPLHSSSIFSAIPSSSIVKIMPPFFSQPESPTQCSFVPHALYEPILPPSASNCLDVSDVAPPNYFPAPPVYEPISPPPASNRKDATDSAPPDSYYAHPVYEPISPPPASNIKDVTKSVPSNSYPAPPVYEPISPPPASDRKDLNNVAPPYPSATLSSAKLTHPTECEEPADACIKSILKEKHDTAPSKTHCFPNLPKVLEQSNASKFLSVKGLFNTDLIIGLSNILECRRILKPTFFLCLNCTDKVSRENFCDHMTSERHKHMSIKTQYHEIFQQWQSTHQTTTHDLVEKLALAEKGLDATVIKLTQNQYESLCSADFCDAIEILQRMFGPCLDESVQLSPFAGQNQRNHDISLVRLLPESVKADKERDNQSPQNYDNTIQIKEIQVPLKGNALKHMDLTYINKTRTEADAVVGLSAVIEFRSESETSLYLCVACCRKLKPDLISCHLVKPGHRYNYLKKRYPFLFVDWSDSESRTEISTRLMRLAHKVEMTNADEPGQLQVMKLNCDDLKEIKAMSYDKAIIYLQNIRKELSLCALNTCISPKITKNLIKQESVETDVTTQCSSQLPGMNSLGPRRALKRSAVEDSVHQTSPEREQCSDVPSTQLKQSHVIGNKQKPSDLKRSKISGTGLDNVAKVQKESFILTTTKPNRSLHSTPGSVLDTSGSSPRTLHPSSQTKETTSMDQSVIKNNEKQESTSIIAPQQKDPCINTSTISALSSIKGQEIGRLCEKRPLVKKSLSENAWSYENRQFSPERTSKANINPVADNSTESVVMNQQCSIANTVHNNNEAGNPLYNSKIADHSLDTNLTHNINANVYSSMVSTYGTMASVTSQVTPSYAESNQYPICTHPNYSSANTVPSDYLGPVDETAMNYEAAPPGLDTNATYYTNLNSTHTSHTVYHSQPVYQPIQSFHIPEIYQAHYACYPYNQVLHTTQTTAGEGNATSTPAFEHGVYPLASWPQK